MRRRASTHGKEVLTELETLQAIQLLPIQGRILSRCQRECCVGNEDGLGSDGEMSSSKKGGRVLEYIRVTVDNTLELSHGGAHSVLIT
jgi:hypothetical protein